MTQEAPLIAVLERTIRASLDRIWENVLDWEHLPHLHSQAFTACDLHHADSTGWKATLGIPGAGDAAAVVEVKLDRPNFCYRTTTVEGLAAGSEILTMLAPRSERTTAIRVEFRVPDVVDEAVEAVGAYYLELYDKLWDQDEEMMTERQRLLDSRRQQRGGVVHDVRADVPVMLGSEAEVRASLPLDVEVGTQTMRVVEIDGELFAYSLTCPHLGGPLVDSVIEDCRVECPWHGYRFDVRSGESSDGRRLKLKPVARVRVLDNGDVVLDARAASTTSCEQGL